MNFWSFIIVVSILLEVSLEVNVSYHELESLGVSCYPYDTCNTEKENMEHPSRKCKCDNKCAYYGDCCLDAPYRHMKKRLQIHNNNCLRVNDETYFAVSTCKNTWRDFRTKRKCEGKPINEDPYTLIPVTSRRSKITYKNRYCAICRQDDRYLNFWRVGIRCSSSNLTLRMDNLLYNYRLRSWGIQLPNQEFVKCYMEPVAPKNIQLLRRCYKDMKSTCTGNWKDDLVREKCESYTAVIDGLNGKYRNIHCAICNGIDIQRYNCYSLRAHRAKGGFLRIFDTGLDNDTECPRGFVWDSKFKRCRRFGCGLPFLVLKNGRCVPIS